MVPGAGGILVPTIDVTSPSRSVLSPSRGSTSSLPEDAGTPARQHIYALQEELDRVCQERDELAAGLHFFFPPLPQLAFLLSLLFSFWLSSLAV